MREKTTSRWFFSQGCSKSRLFIAFRGYKIKNYTQKVVFRVVYHRKKRRVYLRFQRVEIFKTRISSSRLYWKNSKTRVKVLWIIDPFAQNSSHLIAYDIRSEVFFKSETYEKNTIIIFKPLFLYYFKKANFQQKQNIKFLLFLIQNFEFSLVYTNLL